MDLADAAGIIASPLPPPFGGAHLSASQLSERLIS